MLKGISPLISPELLSVLYRMGHGDEIVFADAHFPGESINTNVIRADGLSVSALLGAVLPLLELDSYVDDPVTMMETIAGDTADPAVLTDYQSIIESSNASQSPIKFIERFEFYGRAEQAFAVVMTGDTRKYANLMLKKGVTPEV